MVFLIFLVLCSLTPSAINTCTYCHIPANHYREEKRLKYHFSNKMFLFLFNKTITVSLLLLCFQIIIFPNNEIHVPLYLFVSIYS
jgi:hypothetical protein